MVTLTLTILPCDTIDINENNMTNLTIYPNPTTGIVNLQLDGNAATGNEIQVFDVYGKLLLVVETRCTTSPQIPSSTSLQTMQIDLSNYANGVYLIQWAIGGKVMAVRKVVKE